VRSDLIQLAASFLRPLAPEPSGVAPDLRPLDGIRAVLFDVYGTLLVSAAGEPIEFGRPCGVEAVRAAVDACGVALRSPDDAAEVDRLLHKAVRDAKRRRRDAGVAHPEIDIVAIWAEVLDRSLERGFTAAGRSGVDLEKLALVHECVVNPVWRMPGAADALAVLRGRGLVLGIVSNAQFYTPVILRALLGTDLADLGVDDGCSAWSYRAGIGKPDPALFALAAGGLRVRHGIAPGDALFVGNHMEKDVTAAAAAGFRTCLFAGDARSLRLAVRSGAPARPDAVVAALDQIPGLLVRA